jgi:hypothetical protein
MYMPWGATQEQATVFFTMNIKDCNWLIRFVRDEGTNAANARDYEEASFDGTNIYYLSNIQSAVERQRRKGVKMAPNIAHGRSYIGQVFNLRLADEVGPIWLAYASACYLQGRTNDLVEPAMAFDGSGDRYGPPLHKKLKAKWTLSETEPRFPTRVVYLSDGYMRSPSGQVRRPPPYDAGFTNAVYEVDAFTNVTGTSFPLTSSLKVYRPRAAAATNKGLYLFVEYRINLTSIATTVQVATFQPAIPGVTMLQDERSGRLFYNATSTWPTVEELSATPYFQEVRRVQEASRVKEQYWPAHSRWPVRVFLIVLSILPIAAYIWRRLSSRGPQIRQDRV